MELLKEDYDIEDLEKLEEDRLADTFEKWREEIEKLTVEVRLPTRDTVKLSGMSRAMGGGEVFQISNSNRGGTYYGVRSGKTSDGIDAIAKAFANAFKEYKMKLKKIEDAKSKEIRALMDKA